MRPKLPKSTLAIFYLEKIAIPRKHGPAFLKAIENTIRGFGRVIGREPKLADLTTENIENYANTLQAARTRQVRWDHLHLIWHAAFKLGDLPNASEKWVDKRPKPRPPIDRSGPITIDSTLMAFYEAIYWPKKAIQCSPHTRRLHIIAIGNFKKFLGRQPMMTDLNDTTITAFLAWRLERVAAITANRDTEKIIAMWRSAARKRIVDEWPEVTKAIEPKRIPRAWTEAETSAMFNATKDENRMIYGIPGPLWWRALLLVIYDTAERITAVLGLRWEDIDFSSGEVVYIAENRKGRRADKACTIHAETLTLLRTMPRRSPLVFPLDCCLGTIYNRLKKILKRADLPHDRRSKFHRIRRTTASLFEAAGGNATDLLGHSSRTITKESYLDPRIVKQQSPCDLLPRPKVSKWGAL